MTSLRSKPPFKPQKPTSQSSKTNMTLYFQIGLILSLTMVYLLFEMKFEYSEALVSENRLSEEPDYMIDPPLIEEIVRKEPEQQLPSLQKKIIKTPKIIDDDVFAVLADTLFTDPSPTDPPILDPDDIVVPKDPGDQIYSVLAVEQAPVYPGCEDFESNSDRIQCMSDKLSRLVKRRFNTGLASEFPSEKPNKIILYFTIDKNGKVGHLKARSPHKSLRDEAIQVGKRIPDMKAARHGTEPVSVMYALPIVVSGQH